MRATISIINSREKKEKKTRKAYRAIGETATGKPHGASQQPLSVLSPSRFRLGRRPFCQFARESVPHFGTVDVGRRGNIP